MLDREPLRLIAYGQHDLITRGQALDAGLTSWQWQRGAAGLLEPVLIGVKRVASPMTPSRDALRALKSRAAVLVGGPEARACLGTALRIAGVLGTPFDDAEHVLLRSDGWHNRKEIRRHSFAVAEAELVSFAETAAVSVLRSLRDVAVSYATAELLSVVDSALHLKLLTEEERQQLCRAVPSRASLLRFADGRRESPLESRFALVMAKGGITDVEPQVTYQLDDFGEVRVDFLVGKSVIVECDGREAHPLFRGLQDKLRQEALERQGFVFVRVTWEEVCFHPVETLARIRRALEHAHARDRGWLPPVAAGLG